MAIEGHIDWYIAGNSIDNLSYILTKNGLSKEAVYVILRDIVADLTVTVIDHEIIQKVLKEWGSDIEDAIAYYSAIYSGVSHIVTRNAVDFIHDEATICTPSDFLRLMEAKV